MPIKKPKQIQLPKPFTDLEASEDDDQRRRAILMKRELNQGEGYSWNQKLPLRERLRQQLKTKLLGAVLAGGMGVVLISGFFAMADTGYVPGPTLIYFQSWKGDRSAEDAQADQAEAMDRLRAEVERNRAAVAAAEARAKALEAERAAAARASS